MYLWVPNFPSLFRGKRILDLGAGCAPLGILVAQRFDPAAVVSLDVGFEGLRTAVDVRKQLRPLSLVCGSALALPFHDKSFDLVVANSLLHHLPNVGEAAAEITRVLKPGGYYIGREPNFNNPLLRLAVFKLQRTFVYPATCSPNEHPLRSKEIVRAFSRAGCRCRLQYFWRRLPWLQNPILSVAMSVQAQRQ